MKIFFQDIREEAQMEIFEELKLKLKSEISELVESGIDRNTAEIEVVDYHINVRNFAIPLPY